MNNINSGVNLVKSGVADVVGPFYNYADHIIDPGSLGVSDSGSLGTLMKDLKGIATYVDTMTFGKKMTSAVFGGPSQSPLGNKYFIRSGWCSKESTPECRGKDRYIYIDNIPSGKIPCLNKIGISLPGASFIAGFFKGLVPGLLEDTAKLNPVRIWNSLAGKGSGISDKCSLRTENVGYEGNFTSVTKCSPPNPQIPCSIAGITEKFQNRNNIETRNKNIIILLCFFFIILLLIFK